MPPLGAPPRALALAVAFTLLAGHALAWGASGHRIIGRLGVESLPASAPGFLRTAAAAEAVGELAREPDRWKDSGKVHDSDRDPAHFLDLGDDGRVLGGPALAALPTTRSGYDAAVRAAGGDSWKAGYLPYAIVDSWQQLAKDFAYLRVEEAGARAATLPGHRSWLAADEEARRALILRDIGVLAHYVGDGSQPMHVSQHFNGWGEFPNPDGFTQARIHAAFEGAFVRANVSQGMVRARLPAAAPAAGSGIEPRVAAYLAATNREIRPLYALEKAGGYTAGDPRGRAFVATRLAAGAAELRDEIMAAWRASARGEVGWPAVKVADVLAGRVDPFDSLFGLD